LPIPIGAATCRSANGEGKAPGAKPIPERLSHATIITGFDSHSVRSATQKIAYVAASRGREDIEVFVDSVADLSPIQNRSDDRKVSVEMAFEPDQNDRRAELKQLFQRLQRIRSVKAEPPERERVVHLCRQAAQTLEPGRTRGQAADLQEHAIRNAQEANRRAEAHERHRGLNQTQKRPQGRSMGHGMGF
jgi:hypothetical protein